MVVEAVFEVAARKRVVLSQPEFSMLGEKLCRSAADTSSDDPEGAQLAAQWIQAVQAGGWGGPIPLEGSTARAVHRVLHTAYFRDADPGGLGSLYNALDAELEAAAAATLA